VVNFFSFRECLFHQCSLWLQRPHLLCAIGRHGFIPAGSAEEDHSGDKDRKPSTARAEWESIAVIMNLPRTKQGRGRTPEGPARPSPLVQSCPHAFSSGGPATDEKAQAETSRAQEEFPSSRETACQANAVSCVALRGKHIRMEAGKGFHPDRVFTKSYLST